MQEDREYRPRRFVVPSGQHCPPLVVGLVLVNLGIFFLHRLLTSQPQMVTGAISVEALQKGEWWTVFTHLFVHSDWPHVILNMLVLVLAARRVYADAGPKHFLFIYLVSGWVAAAVTLMLHPENEIVGASGCIAGVFGAYAALHPERSVTSVLGGWAPYLSARSLYFGMLLAAFGLELFSVFTSGTWHLPMVHGVAHSAHAAGLLAGWLYARHLSPSLESLYHREDFFPQGLRRRHRELDTASVPGRSGAMRRSPGSLPDQIFLEAPPAPLSNDEFVRESVDPVLDKLYAQGMASLTEAERRILDEAANRFANKKL
jgi:membrane associated rhomboid family serine protease